MRREPEGLRGILGDSDQGGPDVERLVYQVPPGAFVDRSGIDFQ